MNGAVYLFPIVIAALASVACAAAGFPHTPSALLESAGDPARPVEGVQDMRYLRAGDIRPGGFAADLTRLTPEGSGGFVFEPISNWGEYRYRFRVLARSPADRDPKAPASDGPVSLERVPFADLALLTNRHRPRLVGTIDRVQDGGEVLVGRFRFAEEDIAARLELLFEQRAGPQPEATWRNLPYGLHWHQTFDLYLADLAPGLPPAPLVVVIHGGGWGALDKDNTLGLHATLPAAGIHVASINYRFIHTAPEHGIEPAVLMPLGDAARALQTLRWLAAPLRIDPGAIGAVGGSAGGFSALWLALHADMAEPDSTDPIARQSTRLQAAAGLDAQTSLDPAQMRAWIPAITYGAHAFGIYEKGGDADSFDRWLSERARWLPWIQRLSPYALATADAPPILLTYPRRGLDPEPAETGWEAHSPKFGIQLHRRLQALGVESFLHHKDAADPRYGGQIEAFFIDVLMRDR
jgi:acetyl esterase/lipase